MVHSGTIESYAIITDPYAPVRESATYNCCHCQYVVHVHFGSGKERGHCYLCDAPTCGKQNCMTSCHPFLKKIEEIENRYRLHKALAVGYDK